MKAIGKVVVVWALALSGLFALPAVSMALPRFTAGTTYCGCTCRWGGGVGGGYGNLYWPKVGACGLANGKACSYTQGKVTYSGKLDSCMDCQADNGGGLSCSNTAGANRPPVASVPMTPIAPPAR